MQVMITRENYEEYLMLEADGELDAAGQRALDQFFKTHPELEAERAMWQSIKLTPDEELVFPNQEQLLKTAPKAGRRIIPFMWAAAAAAILFAILFPIFLKNNEKGNQWTRKQSRVHSTPTETAPVNPSPLKPAPEAHPQPMVPEHVAQKSVSPVQPVSPKKQAPDARRQQDLAPLEMIADRQAPAPAPMIASPALQPMNVDASIANAVAETEQSSPHVSLAPANQDAVRLLKDALDERVNQAKNIAKNLREAAIEIRVRKGAININF
jgi:hypothetical protein